MFVKHRELFEGNHFAIVLNKNKAFPYTFSRISDALCLLKAARLWNLSCNDTKAIFIVHIVCKSVHDEKVSFFVLYESFIFEIPAFKLRMKIFLLPSLLIKTIFLWAENMPRYSKFTMQMSQIKIASRVLNDLWCFTSSPASKCIQLIFSEEFCMNQ